MTPPLTPIKKTPGRKRLEWEKEFNRTVSSTRATIVTLKKWKILSTGYRHRLTEPPSIISLITKLELYRIEVPGVSWTAVERVLF